MEIALSASALAVLTYIAFTLSPIVVAVITKANASSKFKALALLVVTLVTTLVSHLIDTGGEYFEFWPFVGTEITGLTIAIAMHYGVWRSEVLGVTGSGGAVQRITNGKGLG